MKVVDLVTRNSDQLRLHFYDFSTNLYRFYKFTALENKKEKELFAQRPLEEVISSQICPWPDFGAGEAAGGWIPAPAAAGGEGELGEEQESGERNLGVARVGRGMAGGGSSAEQGLRRRRRRSGGPGWRQAGWGAPVEDREACCGVVWGGGRPEG